jgi:hypothetical protein
MRPWRAVLLCGPSGREGSEPFTDGSAPAAVDGPVRLGPNRGLERAPTGASAAPRTTAFVFPEGTEGAPENPPSCSAGKGDGHQQLEAHANPIQRPTTTVAQANPHPSDRP